MAGRLCPHLDSAVGPEIHVGGGLLERPFSTPAGPGRGEAQGLWGQADPSLNRGPLSAGCVPGPRPSRSLSAFTSCKMGVKAEAVGRIKCDGYCGSLAPDLPKAQPHAQTLGS